MPKIKGKYEQTSLAGRLSENTASLADVKFIKDKKSKLSDSEIIRDLVRIARKYEAGELIEKGDNLCQTA